MVEVTKEKKQLGIFNARGLREFQTREEIVQFVQQNRFFVLFLNENCEHIKKHPIIKRMEQKGCGNYSAIAIIINGVGMERFKDTFHRSSTHVDQRMIPYKDFQKIFEGNNEIFAFFDYLVKEFNEIQIKGMKQIFLREKVVQKKVVEN